MSARFKTRPIDVSAVRWFKVGDEPGSIVANQVRYPIPHCFLCGKDDAEHGYLDYLSPPQVCPGSWIVSDLNGYIVEVCSDATFTAKYEPAGATTPEQQSRDP